MSFRLHAVLFIIDMKQSNAYFSFDEFHTNCIGGVTA